MIFSDFSTNIVYVISASKPALELQLQKPND